MGAAGGGTVPRTCLFNHLSGKTFHEEWQKRFEGICVLLLSLLYGIPKAGGSKLKHFRAVSIPVPPAFFAVNLILFYASETGLVI